MLRELMDESHLEDLLGGIAGLTGWQFAAYDHQRTLIVATPTCNAYLNGAGNLPPRELPRLSPLRIPSREPPAELLIGQTKGIVHVAAPVVIEQQVAGYAVLGGLRQEAEACPLAEADDALRAAFEALPSCDWRADSQALKSLRWVARQLGELGRRERRVASTTEKLTLMSDIASLLTGEQDLQRILEHIVAETARALGCRYCSLRLYNPETKELELTAGYNLSEQYLAKGVVRRQATSIDDDALRGEMVYVEDARSDPRFQFSEAARREGIVSVLTTGMLYHDRPVGVMRVYTDRKQHFRAPQKELLRAVAAQAAVAIVNARLIEQRVRSATLEREVAVAGEVQKRMLGTAPPPSEHVSIAQVVSPTRSVSGDFCDYLSFCDGSLAVVIGDVVGKGIPAALLGSMLRGAMRASAEACYELGELFTLLNRQLCRETHAREFATMVMAVISPDGRELTYCSAGHEPLLLVRDGELQPLEDGGLVIGIDPAQTYQATKVPLQPGDFLLLYTDGAIDGMNFAGETFGRERLNTALATHASLPPTEAVRSIEWDLRRFIGLAEQADDITLIGVRVH